MAVHAIPSTIEILDATGESMVDPSRCVSSFDPDGVPEVHLGAFRGVAFALIFQVVLFLLGAVAWEFFRSLR